jgi:transposase InsO family protein
LSDKIHHSDQGVQYAATDYVERLRGVGVKLSIAAVGEPRENGYAERLMRTTPPAIREVLRQRK